MSNYNSSGSNLDNIFAPRGSLTAISTDTGFRVDGADIRQRYAPASAGTPPGTNTGYVSGNHSNQDIRHLFAAEGTLLNIALSPTSYSRSGQNTSPTGPFSAYTSFRGSSWMSFLPNGALDGIAMVYGAPSGGGPQEPLAQMIPTFTGNWASPTSSGLGNDYELRITNSATDPLSFRYGSNSPSVPTFDPNNLTWSNITSSALAASANTGWLSLSETRWLMAYTINSNLVVGEVTVEVRPTGGSAIFATSFLVSLHPYAGELQ